MGYYYFVHHLKKYWEVITIAALIAANIFVWQAVRRAEPTNFLTVAFLDIGQGDSIYIESPTHHRMLLDAGPNGAVLTELGKLMPFYERTIDVIMPSHPDSDHIAGFPKVLAHYNVKAAIDSGSRSDTNKIDDELWRMVKEQNIPTALARRGMIIHLGGGADVHILFPDRDVTGWETNTASIVAKLTYGNESFVLTGDSPQKIEKYLVSLDTNNFLKSTVLKPGHHGSKTSTSEEFLTAISPEYAVISAGQNNRYGHPNKETTDLLDRYHILTLITFEQGTITFKTDGNTLQVLPEREK